MTDDLPLVSPPFDADAGADSGLDDGDDAAVAAAPSSHVAGVLLAAGTSERFGDRNKLLADLDGDAVVRHAATTLVEAGLDPIVVVVGHEADRIRAALVGLPVEFAYNDVFETGQASSLATGIRELGDPDDVDAVIVALGDMPFVSPGTIESLVAAHDAGVADAAAAAHEGQRGNPVMFDGQFFGALETVDGDVGGREILLNADESALVAVDDDGVRRDVDVPSDL